MEMELKTQRLTVTDSRSVPAAILIVSLAMPSAAVKLLTAPGLITTETPCAGVSSGFKTSTCQQTQKQLNYEKSSNCLYIIYWKSIKVIEEALNSTQV